ncbi:D-xylulose 5-phosphate/D-fructose 6-phosphate phosphoketolase [Halopseudomonas pelagia]|uniref:D-xylulose 5-phosphate/D-fructose 6-phosphate phosphoketolase n=1 Tax=Halopseudomonas pelagia TaxID=553151 RepID=UPI00039BD2A0|nr:D-xylulose 5-phosphate/D-fructose 6-phosphate phosphoketolase [Halopseudomonas pelagia]
MSQLLPDQSTLDDHAKQCPAFARWSSGQGVISHAPATQAAVYRLAHQLVQREQQPNVETVYQLMTALDQVTSAGLWLVVHMTYAKRCHPDGTALAAEDFKSRPEGHTGGALNMVPAYAAYLALNSLTGHTRSWLMGQGHCVAAIDALNVLISNLHPEQAQRYASDAGLDQLLKDFYSYAQLPDGRPAAPLGSHVNPYTAGGIIEGGYLGFAELQYAHMPLPGETLVAFLSDGAAEEQRGSDWIPRWWRAEDCGAALPVMIANGRRIEQRTELGTQKGLDGFAEHLKGCGFDPIRFDGRDPAAFVCTLLEMEQRLERRVQEYRNGILQYPLPIPYAIAETTKGFGFYGAGQNAAHNLPLPGNPRHHAGARELFNQHAAQLWIDPQSLSRAREQLQNHARSGRPLERDHALATRNPAQPVIPLVDWSNQTISPMQAVDRFFVALVEANPALRARVGNPDELASNRLGGVLEALKHRVCDPESALEAVDGRIITALNEEAVVSACLGNKGGLNLVASYEAFCVKMLGAIRQELIFARHQAVVQRPAKWLGFPVIATSHTWENGKNEQSHQDTTFCEALLGEMHDGMRVLFPADYNSTLALLPSVYQARGQISCMVIAKRDCPSRMDATQARLLADQGAIVLAEHHGPTEPLLLIANGGYQLGEMLRAAQRLTAHDQSWRLVYLQEPGRFSVPRDSLEAQCTAPAALTQQLFPTELKRRVVLTHMRPEIIRGHLHNLLPSPRHSRVLGYINQGGTLDEAGMLFANRCSWAHVLVAAAEVLDVDPQAWMDENEWSAVDGQGNPALLR